MYILYLIRHTTKLFPLTVTVTNGSGSVIHSLVTCVQTSSVLWIEMYTIQILWKLKNLLLTGLCLNDPVIIRRRRQRRLWRCCRVYMIYSSIICTVLQGSSSMRICRLFVTDASVLVTWVRTITYRCFSR